MPQTLKMRFALHRLAFCATILYLAHASPLTASWVPEGGENVARAAEKRSNSVLIAAPGLAMQNAIESSQSERLQRPFSAPLGEYGEYTGGGQKDLAENEVYPQLAPSSCPAYDASQFTRKPVEAQKWWEEQQKRDANESAALLASGTNLYGELTPLAQGRKYFAKPYVAPAPRFVAYTCCASSDDNITYAITKASELKAINVFNIAFFTLTGPQLKANVWYNMTLKDRRALVDSFHAANKSIMLSFFGGDAAEEPTTKRYDPVALAKLHGEIVRESGFDGIDIDYEDFDAMSWNNYSAPYWISAYVHELRTQLPQPDYALTAAPVAPWFTPNRTTFCHGAYSEVAKLSGSKHTWYNLQYYNQGVGAYDSCDTLLFQSNATGYQQTSIFEISMNGVPLDQLVIGKPGWPADAGDGYMDPDLLGTCSAIAKAEQWKGGIMSFQWPHAGAEWFRTARLQSFYPD